MGLAIFLQINHNDQELETASIVMPDRIDNLKVIKELVISDNISFDERIQTIEYDGHKFIIYRMSTSNGKGVSIINHPDCSAASCRF